MNHDAASTRYPGYDVLNKRDSPSWDAITRQVVDERLSLPLQPRYFDPTQWAALTALCACIVAQPDDRPAIPIAAMLDARLLADLGDGWRNARLPPLREAWRVGLAALDAESHADHGAAFAQLAGYQQTTLVERMQRGELQHAAWQGMPPALFFGDRVLHDLYGAYYSHPFAWSEIGFGGPANPRGYVRLYTNRRDPWEAVESRQDSAHDPDQEDERVRQENDRVR